MNRMRIWISLLGLSLLAAAPALAQLQSLPVYFSPKGGTGLTLDVDFGRDASNKLAGVPTLNHPTTIAAFIPGPGGDAGPITRRAGRSIPPPLMMCRRCSASASGGTTC